MVLKPLSLATIPLWLMGTFYSYTVPVVVTSSRNGNLSVKLQAQNQYSINGNEALSNTVLNNNIGPSVNISSVSLPVWPASY